MNKCIINNKEPNRIIKETNNYKENQINEKKELNLNFNKTGMIKITCNNSKEKNDRFFCHYEINKRKIYKDKLVHKYKAKKVSIVISKSQSYYTIKYNKLQLYLLLNMIILFINIFLSFGGYNQNKFSFKSSEIKLIIKEKGNIKLFSDDFLQNYNNFNIYLNNILIDTNKNELCFDSYNSEELNIIRIIWNETILTTKNMFKNCYKIFGIDLSNFDTSKVNDMSYMFYNCSSLVSLNLSNLNTCLVSDMSYMFYNCSSIGSLYLSNFDTSQVYNTNNMFFNCSNLIYLNLSSFNTSGVTNMASMFFGCKEFTSLDLSNFDTSKVTSMSSLFSGCSNLQSLNLSSFNTSKVINMASMFYACKGFI